MHRNNFDFLRLVAAFLVLVGHSLIFLGHKEVIFLNYTPLGPLGVTIFFALSGFLVSESWDRDPNVIRFFMRRSLRIFPGLAVCVLLSILVLGPALTTFPITEYFLNSSIKTYLWNILLYPIYYLPGVFEHNRVPNAVNGSLWSLPAEFLMYILLCFIGLFSFRRTLVVFFAILCALLCYFWVWRTTEMLVFYGTDLRQVAIVGVYFWVGAAFSAFNVQRWFSLSGVVVASALFLSFSAWPELARISSWVLLPYIVLSFGMSHSPLLSRLTRFGDCSYGIYIYAFPIQQSVVYFWPNMALGGYLLICSVVTLIFAVASWRFVESRALTLKPSTPRRVAASEASEFASGSLQPKLASGILQKIRKCGLNRFGMGQRKIVVEEQ